jgi:hypothetical protein
MFMMDDLIKCSSDGLVPAGSGTGVRRPANGADIPRPDPATRRAMEQAYRKGIHQALVFAYGLVERSAGRREALRRLGRAEHLVGELRYKRRDEDVGRLLEWLRREMAGTPS